MLFKFQTTTTAYRIALPTRALIWTSPILLVVIVPIGRSLLHPWHLDYASEVWDVASGSISKVEKLEQVKLTATKMISGL